MPVLSLADIGPQLVSLLEELGHSPLRRTDRHWRLYSHDQMIDVEIDGERGMLCMTSDRLCAVPADLASVVTELCLDQNQRGTPVKFLQENAEVFCRVCNALPAGASLDIHAVRAQLLALAEACQSFMGRLLNRCVDDLLVCACLLQEKPSESIG